VENEKCAKKCVECGEIVEKFHPKDPKSCHDCAEKLFDSIKPDLTRWMDGLRVAQKSRIIREVIAEHFRKKRHEKALVKNNTRAKSRRKKEA